MTVRLVCIYHFLFDVLLLLFLLYVTFHNYLFIDLYIHVHNKEKALLNPNFCFIRI